MSARQKAGPTRYFDPEFKRDAIKILPGEYFVAGAELLLVTVLGSCVAACIRDRLRGIGGMNHFMLPEGADQNAGARYGLFAMEILVNDLLKRGAQRQHLEAKVFGGGNVLAAITSNNVGERNAEFVLDYLATENIKVVAQDLLESHPRKVYYFPDTGKARVRALPTQPAQLVGEERAYGQRLTRQPAAGEIVLF